MRAICPLKVGSQVASLPTDRRRNRDATIALERPNRRPKSGAPSRRTLLAVVVSGGLQCGKATRAGAGSHTIVQRAPDLRGWLAIVLNALSGLVMFSSASAPRRCA